MSPAQHASPPPQSTTTAQVQSYRIRKKGDKSVNVVIRLGNLATLDVGPGIEIQDGKKGLTWAWVTVTKAENAAARTRRN